ncbi:unnamed protein product [Lactuca saligna]|uniref:Uncharacterized protein n=1 Tax=Lactuca saligna TaxID=75948 RepID=A0AA35V0G1_LACSI|nr:unnamed protein product [Lactuca saligna]
MFFLQSDLRSAIQIAATFCYLNPSRYESPFPRPVSVRTPPRLRPPHAAAVERISHKPPICTADELHYVSIHNSDWRLALWRYKPPPKAPSRNHPLLLLSGVGTNAIGYDLAPGAPKVLCIFVMLLNDHIWFAKFILVVNYINGPWTILTTHFSSLN